MNIAVNKEEKNYRIAFALAVFTIVYNFVEGILATWLGYEDETLALFGFGVDSFIELISGLGIMLMVLRIQQNPGSHRSSSEKLALKTTGISFYLLVAGLIVSIVISLLTSHKPSTTIWGVGISLLSIVVMIVLLRAKLKVGKELQSEAILSDASCTKVCIYMSIVLLLSSGIYEVTGFAYADALGTAGIAWFSYQEGKECFEKAASEKYCHHH